MMVRFRYNDLLRESLSRGPHYLESVLKSSRRVGSDIVMTRDAYYYIKSQFRVVLPEGFDANHPVECCGSGASKSVKGDKQ